MFVVDPMLATGGSAIAALSRLREVGASDLRLVAWSPRRRASRRSARSSPTSRSPSPRWTAGSTSAGFIQPGLGDAGDRIFGTE